MGCGRLDEFGKARLVIEGDGTISLYNGYTEMGQGLLTVLVQFAVEITGLPAAIFRPKVDSTYALACGQTTGSRATLFGGRAVKSAAEKLRAELDAGRKLEELVGEVFAADVVNDDTTAPGETKNGKIKTHTAFGYATQVVILDAAGRVEKVIAAHDVGKVMNPTLLEGQIEGSIHMGLGYALTEDLVVDGGDGRLASPRVSITLSRVASSPSNVWICHSRFIPCSASTRATTSRSAFARGWKPDQHLRLTVFYIFQLLNEHRTAFHRHRIHRL